MRATRAVLVLGGVSFLFASSICAQHGGGHGGGGHGGGGHAGGSSGHGSGHASSHNGGRSGGHAAGLSGIGRALSAPKFHSMPPEARGVLSANGRGNFSPLPESALLPRPFSPPGRALHAASPAPRGFAAASFPAPHVREHLFFNFGFGFPIDRRFFGPRFHRAFFGHSVFFGGGPFFCDPFFFPCWDRFFFDPLASAALPPAILFGAASSAAPGMQVDEPESNGSETLPEEDRPGGARRAEGQVTLLQIKDGPMYGLRDYWVEGGRLRYITDYGGENSVSLDSIDLAETIRLNNERGIAFTLDETRARPPNSSDSPAPPSE